MLRRALHDRQRCDGRRLSAAERARLLTEFSGRGLDPTLVTALVASGTPPRGRSSARYHRHKAVKSQGRRPARITVALREEDDNGSLSLAAFYVRRCFRIFPLYYLLLGVYGLLILGLGFSPHLRPVFCEALPYYVGALREQEFAYRGLLLGREVAAHHRSDQRQQR